MRSDVCKTCWFREANIRHECYFICNLTGTSRRPMNGARVAPAKSDFMDDSSTLIDYSNVTGEFHVLLLHIVCFRSCCR